MKFHTNILIRLLYCGLFLSIKFTSMGQDTIAHQAPSLKTTSPKINFVRFGLQGSGPVNALKRNYQKLPIGLYLSYFRQVKTDKPLFVGSQLSYQFMESYSGDVLRNFDTISEIWEATTTSSMLRWSIDGLYFPNWGFLNFEPYFVANIGTHILLTSTSFSFPDSDETDNSLDHLDSALFYGGGMGLMYYLDNNWYLDFNTTYTKGLSTKYYVEKDSKPFEPSSTFQGFEAKQSTIDLFNFQLGVNFSF